MHGCYTCHNATPVELCTNVDLIEHTHQHTHAGSQKVNLTAGVGVRIIGKEEKEGAVTSARPGTVTKVVNRWRNRPKTG